MSKKKAKTYTVEFKSKVALEAIRGDMTLNEISKKYGIHTTQINRWKQQALAGIKESFSSANQKVEKDNQKIVDDLYRHM